MISAVLLATAAAAGPLGLDLSGCPSVDAAEVRRLLAFELGRPVPAADAAPLRVACEGSVATVRLDDERGARVRRVELSSVAPVAQARLLALTAAELVGVPAPPPAPVVQTQAAPAPAPAWGATVFAVGQLNAGVLALGGGGRLSRALGGWLTGHLDVAAARGSRTVAPGSVLVDALSAGLAIMPGRALGGWRLEAGAGLRATLARLGGRPGAGVAAEGATVSGLTGGPLLALAVTSPGLGPVVAQVWAEGGWAVRAVEGRLQGGDEIAVRGPWMGLTLGLGLGR